MPAAVTLLKTIVDVLVGLTDTLLPAGVAPGTGGGGATNAVTVTVNEWLVVICARLVAVQFTVVVPTAKSAADAGVHTAVSGPSAKSVTAGTA